MEDETTGPSKKTLVKQIEMKTQVMIMMKTLILPQWNQKLNLRS